MATAIHREHFLVTMLKKEISTAKELDLRPLGKVIIFRDKQTDRTFLLYIDPLFFAKLKIKELDLRPLGKVIIFRYKQTDKHFLLYID